MANHLAACANQSPSISSYNARASGAGPRRSPKATIRTTRTRGPRAKVSTMPGATVAWGLSRTRPSMRQRDFSTKRVARLRDLKKRACHSHLSSRIAPQALLLSAELQLEQLGERRIAGVALRLGGGLEVQRQPAAVAARRPRPAAILAWPIFSRTGTRRTIVAPLLVGWAIAVGRAIAPAFVLVALRTRRIGEELPLVRPLGSFAAALVTLLLALAHEARLDREGVERPVLIRRRMDAIAQPAQHVGHLGL